MLLLLEDVSIVGVDPAGCCEAKDDDNDDLAVLSSGFAELEPTVGEIGISGIGGGRFCPPTSRSGKVMKNRQPNVVPKKAPSTV
jgi:hypothetical protein